MADIFRPFGSVGVSAMTADQAVELFGTILRDYAGLEKEWVRGRRSPYPKRTIDLLAWYGKRLSAPSVTRGASCSSRDHIFNRFQSWKKPTEPRCADALCGYERWRNGPDPERPPNWFLWWVYLLTDSPAWRHHAGSVECAALRDTMYKLDPSTVEVDPPLGIECGIYRKEVKDNKTLWERIQSAPVCVEKNDIKLERRHTMHIHGEYLRSSE